MRRGSMLALRQAMKARSFQVLAQTFLIVSKAPSQSASPPSFLRIAASTSSFIPAGSASSAIACWMLVSVAPMRCLSSLSASPTAVSYFELTAALVESRRVLTREPNGITADEGVRMLAGSNLRSATKLFVLAPHMSAFPPPSSPSCRQYLAGVDSYIFRRTAPVAAASVPAVEPGAAADASLGVTSTLSPAIEHLMKVLASCEIGCSAVSS
mmetsp:Transcript_40429/g.59510  ORF Transcript_40429/g.59510 Transcript_40429/m.59510 type:complete len:212 (-) Transcript_40429:379-1014(-)